MTSSQPSDVRPLPKVFVLELTRRCNNRCLYCYNEAGVGGLSGSEMSTEEVVSLISKLHSEVPVESIAISGGEPFLREDLPEILSYIKQLGIAPAVITNGTLLTKERVAATAEDVTFEVTLLSYRPEVHDYLAGRAGAWKATFDGMCNVRRAEGSLAAVFVATKLNFADLPITAELAIAAGAGTLMYNRINLGAHNLRRAGELLPTPEMIRENLDVLEELSIQYGIPVSVSVVIEPCVVDVRKYKHLHFGWCPLAGEGAYFTIDPLGNIRICNHSPVIMGNLKRDSFREIYYSHPHVQSFRETWPAECGSCDPELKKLCCGGCRAAAEQCYGTPSRIDPFVSLNLARQGPS